MLPSIWRLRTRSVMRMFARPQTQKIPAYPFVYFVAKAYPVGKAPQWGIQVANKISKSSVRRHMVKRAFYDAVSRSGLIMNTALQGYSIMAVPQKTWVDELTQLLATGDKRSIVQWVSAQCATSLSQFLKKLWSSVESNAPSRPSRNVNSNLKKTSWDSSKQ